MWRKLWTCCYTKNSAHRLFLTIFGRRVLCICLHPWMQQQWWVISGYCVVVPCNFCVFFSAGGLTVFTLVMALFKCSLCASEKTLHRLNGAALFWSDALWSSAGLTQWELGRQILNLCLIKRYGLYHQIHTTENPNCKVYVRVHKHVCVPQYNIYKTSILILSTHLFIPYIIVYFIHFLHTIID